jgi:hypothetical protein
MIDFSISETINNILTAVGTKEKNDMLHVQIIKTSYLKKEKLLSLDRVDIWIDSDGS